MKELKETAEMMRSPDYKESEDGRWIPKEIAKYLKEKGGYRSCWISWLKKQGELKPVEFDDANAKRMFIKALERVEELNNKGYKLTDCDKNSWWEDFKALNLINGKSETG